MALPATVAFNNNETIRNSMKYTLGTAAKATGKSKSTIQRAIKSGKLSAFVCENGSYEIDPSELHRVYSPVASNSSEQPEMTQYATQDETVLLRQENQHLKQQLEREREFLQTVSCQLAKSENERRETQSKLTALLTYKAEPETIVKKNNLFDKIFGRGKIKA